VYDFFRSIKLALVLLIIIAVLSALSTFVPQGEAPGFYANSYSSFFAHLILSIGFHHFFRSALFLIPAGLFFANLAVCMADRMVRRARRGGPKRFGPDLIHLGILILMVGGIISLIGKREGYIYLSEGEYAELPDGYQLFLDSFEHTTYEDGRPKEYVSSVEVVYGDERVGSYEIRVNNPLRVGKLKIYQDSYSSTTTLLLKDEDDGHYALSPGEGFRVEDRLYFFMGIEPGSPLTKGKEDGSSSQIRDSMAVFEELDEGGAPVDRHIVGFRDKIDRLIIDDIFTTDQTGLRVVRDSGFIPVLSALILIGIGLVLTFAQKIGEKAL
jgi:cytochrome c biogenesis protein